MSVKDRRDQELRWKKKYGKGLVEAFKLFDADGSGSLSHEEVLSILTRNSSQGKPLTKKDAEEFISYFDTNADGELAFHRPPFRLSATSSRSRCRESSRCSPTPSPRSSDGRTILD